MILVFAAQTAALFSRSLLELYVLDEWLAPAAAKLASYAIVPPILLLLLYPVWRARRLELRGYFAVDARTIHLVLLGMGAGLCLRLADYAALVARTALAADPVTGLDDVPRISFDCPPASFVILYLAIMMLAVPVIEEIINRGWVATWLTRYGHWQAVIGSALFFAIFHPASGLATAFVFGIFMAWLLFNTGSLWACVSAHATFNGLILLDWYCLNVTWLPESRSTSVLAVGALALVLGTLALVVAGVLVSRKIAGRVPGDPSA